MIRIDSTLTHPDGIYILFQEQVVDQRDKLVLTYLEGNPLPWAIAVGSVVLQRTGRHTAFPVIERLLNEWSPLRCSNSEPWSFRQLVQCLRPSGLPEVKALRIAGFSRAFLTNEPPDIWPGLKGYTRDSVLIFTDGKYLTYCEDELPDDGHLRTYVERWRLHHAAQEAAEKTAFDDDSSDSGTPGGSPTADPDPR